LGRRKYREILGPVMGEGWRAPGHRARPGMRIERAVRLQTRRQRQRAAQNRERPRVSGEVIAAKDVAEPQPSIHPPGPVGLAVGLRGGEQDVALAATCEQAAGQRLTESTALEA